MVGADLHPPLTAQSSGTARDDAVRIDRDRRRRGSGFAVRVGDVGLAVVGAAVLSRAAADDDRRPRLEPLVGADRRLAGALALAAMFGPVFFFAFLASAGLPAWWLDLSGHAGASGRDERQRRGARARMVSARAAGDVGRDPRCAGRRRRHSQFRHRRGKLPRRHAPGAGAIAAGGKRRAGGRAAERARRVQ